MSTTTSYRAIAACGITGLLGGLVLMASTHASILAGPVAGVVFGALFAVVFANRATDCGSGLLWGLAFALLLWLAVVPGAQVISANLSSTFQTQRDNFPELVGYILCFWLPLGVVLGTVGGWRNRAVVPSLSFTPAIVCGRISSLVVGFAFGKLL